jgi:hypothetical protein
VPLRKHTQGVVYLLMAALTFLLVGDVLPKRFDHLAPGKQALVPVALVFALGIAWLSAVRPLTTLMLGFALLGIVRVQPAPVDVVFALLIFSTYVLHHAPPRIPPFIAIPLSAFVVVSLISMVNATDFHRALIFELTTLYVVALAVWLSWAFTKDDWTRLAIKTYVIVAVVCGALGPITLYLPVPGKSTLVYDGTRAMVLFKDPNVYSAFLIPAAIILLEELTTPRLLTWRRSRILMAFGCTTIGAVVAFSRAAWLDYAVAIAALVTIQASRQAGLKRAVRTVALLVFGGLAGIFVLYLAGSLSFLLKRSHLQTYDQQRFSNQGSGIADMTRRLFGYGPGQSEVRLPLATHSYFVRAAFEQGVIGFVSLTVVLFGTLLCALMLARRTSQFNGIGTAALFALWLGQCANSFFIDTIHWRHLWIFAGLIWCAYATTTPQPLARRTWAALSPSERPLFES